eukprot:scaffold3069_cov215-Amphora_coffeaeformis.AAC.24
MENSWGSDLSKYKWGRSSAFTSFVVATALRCFVVVELCNGEAFFFVLFGLVGCAAAAASVVVRRLLRRG